MKSTNVMLSTIDDVKQFVNIAGDYDFDIDLVSGRYAVDAKSIMGIFSLDLSKSLEIKAHCSDAAAEQFFAAIAKFIQK